MKYDPNAGTPFRRPYRFLMAFLILIVPFCTMVPYVAPAVFMGDIMTQYGVNLSLAGLSMTIQLAATGICMFIGSMIQDRLGIRKSVILSIWAMVLGNAMASLSPSIWVFLVARTISGFGQGLYTVSMTPCISTWFADKERTYMLTFNTAANSIFLAVSYSIGRPLCNAFGSWQAVFGFYTAIIALIALLWTFLARDSAEALAAAQQRAKMTTGGKQQSSLRRAAKEIQYWKLLLFAGMALSMTAIEYIAGIVSLKFMHIRLWDYSKQWGNIQGLICPAFSVLWAAVSAVYYFCVHPYILDALDWLSRNLAFSFVIGFFFGVFTIDLVYSAKLVSRIRKFADEHDVVIKVENLKAHIRQRQEERREKYSFLFAYRSRSELLEHLREAQETWEERRRK